MVYLMSEPITSRSVSTTMRGSARPSHGQRKWLIYAGGAVLVSGVYFLVLKPRKAVADASLTDSSTDIPSDAGSTGYYDSGYDTGAYAGDTGYSGAYGTTPSLYGYYDPSTGQFISSGTPSTNGSTTSTIVAPATNAAWVQQAVAFLQQEGYNPVSVLTALGKYVSSTHSVAVSSTELGIIQAAIAAEGYPPKRPPDPHVNPPATQTKKTRKVKTQHPNTIKELCENWHISQVEFAKLNIKLWAKYANTGRKVPAGTTITIYA